MLVRLTPTLVNIQNTRVLTISNMTTMMKIIVTLPKILSFSLVQTDIKALVTMLSNNATANVVMIPTRVRLPIPASNMISPTHKRNATTAIAVLPKFLGFPIFFILTIPPPT